MIELIISMCCSPIGRKQLLRGVSRATPLLVPLLIIIIITAQICSNSINALENGLARTPPMGWLSWERFACETDCSAYPNDCINSKLYREMAERLVDDGYAKLGYQYVNIDDCWSQMERDQASGNLVEDFSRFPEGIEGLAEFIHGKSLKLGIYGDCGTKTCGGYPAQLKSEQNLEDNYFELDAQRFASWQVDSFKFDGCYLDPSKAESICPRMTKAIESNKRPMVVICEWPFYMLREKYDLHNLHAPEPNFTLAQSACNAWRYHEDVEDSWLSVLNIIDFTIRIQLNIYKFHGPGHWFDPDQLIIGNFALSLDEARAQMAIWSVWSAPLYMSNDLRSIDDQLARVLKNEKLIQVNQDPMGVFGLMVAESNSSRYQAFVKPVLPIRNGCPSFVVVYLNRNTLGNRHFVEFKTRDLLTRVPIALAAERYSELNLSRTETTGFSADKCKTLLQTAMTKNPQDASLLNKPVSSNDDQQQQQQQQQTSVSLEASRIEFMLIDLFDDETNELARTILDGDLTLLVNPSGVRAVKLIML